MPYGWRSEGLFRLISPRIRIETLAPPATPAFWQPPTAALICANRLSDAQRTIHNELRTWSCPTNSRDGEPESRAAARVKHSEQFIFTNSLRFARMAPQYARGTLVHPGLHRRVVTRHSKEPPLCEQGLSASFVIGALAMVLAPSAVHAQRDRRRREGRVGRGAARRGGRGRESRPHRKDRSAVTDGEGAIQIIDLRPGTYSVTFTLTGFNTFKRDGVELPTRLLASDQRRNEGRRPRGNGDGVRRVARGRRAEHGAR